MSTDNLVGRTVAGYHLAKYIGEGGTATVYRAEHSDRGESAVKILRPRLASDPIAVQDGFDAKGKRDRARLTRVKPAGQSQSR